MTMIAKPRPTDEEFAELARKRDEAVQAVIDRCCEEQGWDKSKIHFHASHMHGCYCACPEGPCQHIWDGPEAASDEKDGGFYSSATCSRCGTEAIHHDMRCGP